MARSFRSNSVAGFDVGKGEGEKQNPDPENNDVHCACPCFDFSTLRPLEAAWRLHETARQPGLVTASDVFLKAEYGPDRHKGSRRGKAERNRNSIKIFGGMN
ncbi:MULTISPECIES: hypothetical protein [unclassified Mesorhizobium]|uniref:hypothetical protein n=1 Tax=unclassified Mesorhizobium TaxID=325217 RepID=UPI00112DCED7|nr:MULTISPECIES: hypothetical protein [unclassified Mesorhizobium]MBZ9959287.1 hypothetical protein [Mesorhizobium sp. BR1-1-14]TPN12001.1 hypothetical protein FJ973_15060 [Mesorhizobium sp. B2-1-3]